MVLTIEAFLVFTTGPVSVQHRNLKGSGTF